jgi:hypothetical protein
MRLGNSASLRGLLVPFDDPLMALLFIWGVKRKKHRSPWAHSDSTYQFPIICLCPYGFFFLFPLPPRSLSVCPESAQLARPLCCCSALVPSTEACMQRYGDSCERFLKGHRRRRRPPLRKEHPSAFFQRRANGTRHCRVVAYAPSFLADLPSRARQRSATSMGDFPIRAFICRPGRRICTLDTVSLSPRRTRDPIS